MPYDQGMPNNKQIKKIKNKRKKDTQNNRNDEECKFQMFGIVIELVLVTLHGASINPNQCI
jgi:hypothetical protein